MKINHFFGLTLLLVMSLTFNHMALADSWQQVQTTTTPEARQYHSLDYINGKVYLFGGEYVSRRGILSDLWRYDEGNSTWSEKRPPSSPNARKYHATATAKGKLYVFGGQEETSIAGDVWEYTPDTNTWVQLEAGGNDSPLYNRLFFDATAGDDGKIYISGGMDVTTGNVTLSDVWCYDPFDPAGPVWTKVADCSASQGRYGHVAAISGRNLTMGMGRRDETVRGDMVNVDLDTGVCTTIPVQGPVPDPTKFPAFTSTGDWIVFSGGTNQTISQSNQKATASTYSNSSTTWLFNTQTNQWTQGSDGPAQNAGAASYSGYNRFLFYGGNTDTGYSDETWIYTADIDNASSCASVDAQLNINAQCIALGSHQYQANLTHVTHPENANGFLWKLGGAAPISSNNNNCAYLDSQYNISFPCVNVNGTIYRVELPRYNHPSDPGGFYWTLGTATLVP